MKPAQVSQHPLVQEKLARLREKRTGVAEFRRLLNEIGALLFVEASAKLQVDSCKVSTPLARADGVRLRHPILLVPILRAGLPMADGALQICPDAVIGCIGVRRNESNLQPELYMDKLPPRLGRYDIFVFDPMLATGGTVLAAAQLLHQRGAREVSFVHILGTPAGVRALQSGFPQSQIVIAAIDRKLDHRGFIVPGLGDAGDRSFGG